MTENVSEAALRSPHLSASRPPVADGSPYQRALVWMRRNLFSTIPNTLLTVLVVGVIVLCLSAFYKWAVADATWAGDSREACVRGGACWTFVKVHLGYFLYGSYPLDARWRIDLAGLLLLGFGYPVLAVRTRHRGWWAVALFLVFPLVAGVLMVGGIFGLRFVDTSQLGGLTLDILITFVNASAALPIGIVLALGRQSDAAVVRMLATGYIEFWRGVPLISVLFMATLMLPFFLPNGISVNNLLRLMVVMVMFYSAYMAEVIRGGLQGVPKGQMEAASSLGLKWWQMQLTVVLPQAFRLAVPNITNTVVDMFKDTTLVTIIGLADIFGSVSRALNDTSWLGMAMEGYVFAAVVFFVCCFAISAYGRHFETRLNGNGR